MGGKKENYVFLFDQKLYVMLLHFISNNKQAQWQWPSLVCFIYTNFDVEILLE